ncbi:unnamed protein product [Phytophthora lilii]|uniref:Unnamed protein product n=1 Tax=Phytophthora lilii TaxID=2077276 RepID=A0A9W6U6B1_9STRA|nr:unnamed protein product [Phytophthora lilii]
MSDRFQKFTKTAMAETASTCPILPRDDASMLLHSLFIHLGATAQLTTFDAFRVALSFPLHQTPMSPNDRPGNSLSPLVGLPESPIAKSDFQLYLHPRQPFIRYDRHRRRPISSLPGQGNVTKLPGVATLLRRHNAMQSKGLISSVPVPVPDSDYDLNARHSIGSNSSFECWTPRRFAGTSGNATSPDSKWMPLAAALVSTRTRLDEWSNNPNSYDSKSSDSYSWSEGSTASSPVVQSPESVRSTTTESRPKSSRYLREIDRRRILMRIAQGEKQSALAKEYHVSRAAICNLNKHRAEVLSRNHEHPLAYFHSELAISSLSLPCQ